MNFVDDIRRETVDADYERVIGDLLAEFTREELTVYNYGRRRPPLSDLDLLVLTDADVSPRRFRQLRSRLNAFASVDPVRRYLLDDGVRLCPRDLVTAVCALYPTLLPTSFQLLSGAPVDTQTGPRPATARQIDLVDTILMRLNDLAYLRKGASVSVRELLKTLQSISTMVQFHIDEVVALGQRSYPDDDLGSAHDAMTDAIAQLRERAVQSPLDRAFLASLEGCMETAIRLLVDSLVFYCTDFLRSVIAPTVSDENPAEGRDPEKVPELVSCHIAAYAQVGVGPLHLRQRLAQLGSGHPFTIVDAEYRRMLTEQMRVAEMFDARFRHCRVAALPLAIAGVWHQWEPTTKWAAVCQFVGRAQEEMSAGRRHWWSMPGHAVHPPSP